MPQKFVAAQVKTPMQEVTRRRKYDERDEVAKFIHRHKNDRFHWCRGDQMESNFRKFDALWLRNNFYQ